jgi:hemophore-related protein
LADPCRNTRGGPTRARGRYRSWRLSQQTQRADGDVGGCSDGIATLSADAAIASAEPAPAQPPPAPNCTAADLAGVAAGVAAATSAYLFTHPDVNDFFTRVRGLPDDIVRGELRTYMDANPQVHNDLLGIRQPLTDLRDRCQ